MDLMLEKNIKLGPNIKVCSVSELISVTSSLEPVVGKSHILWS